jgi:hypothetical protein
LVRGDASYVPYADVPEAFGNALKNIFESLLVVLIIRPFNVGDVVRY